MRYIITRIHPDAINAENDHQIVAELPDGRCAIRITIRRLGTGEVVGHQYFPEATIPAKWLAIRPAAGA